MQRLTNSIYLETGYLAPNVGCIMTEEGAVLVDSPFLPKDALHWRKELNSIVGNKGISYLINTHCHFDHVLGNSLLCSKIIVQQHDLKGFYAYLDRNMLNADIKMFFPEEFQQYKKELDKVDIILPQIVFFDRLDLYLGGQIIQLISCGGHTRGSILIYIPSDKVLFCGDNVDNGVHPSMGAANFQAWLKLLQDVEQMDIQYVVPGHGEVGDKALVKLMREYFETMIQEVKGHKEAQIEPKVLVEKVKQHMLDYLPVKNKKELEIEKYKLDVGINRIYRQIP